MYYNCSKIIFIIKKYHKKYSFLISFDYFYISCYYLMESILLRGDDIMKSSVVRITEISIHNFKNVLQGEIKLEPTKNNYKSSILGLFGQNGSGKTALIDAIEILKYVLCGNPLPTTFFNYINFDSDYARFKFTFNIFSPELAEQKASYEFSIKKMEEESLFSPDLRVGDSSANNHFLVFDEVLMCPIIGKSKSRFNKLIDTRKSETFSPETKRNLLIGNDSGSKTDLIVYKKFAEKTSRSFIFSNEFQSLIYNHLDSLSSGDDEFEELKFYYRILNSLVKFGKRDLFIINTTKLGLLSFNFQPMEFKFPNQNLEQIGRILFPYDSPITILKEHKSFLNKIILSMNTVLCKIIPNLELVLKDFGVQLTDDGKEGVRVQLVSKRNNHELSLKNESEGIKKIISVLQLLIFTYNNPTITVAIDELDSGIFEYLLGEILRIISEKGKGQLIFTLHNLRPLETLDKNFVAFTTTNPNHRYVRLTNVKETNNLRDFYYRDIMLGEQSEELYELTNNSEISFAFREAGEYLGS